MTNGARFTENETGIEVLVDTVFPWEPHPMQCIITYPSGRRYSLPESELNTHFTIVSPQEVFLSAFGGVDDRPTQKQRELALEAR